LIVEKIRQKEQNRNLIVFRFGTSNEYILQYTNRVGGFPTEFSLDKNYIF